MMSGEDKARQLVTKHWDWLELLLDQQRLMEKRLFVDAFAHGYKHGAQDKQDDIQRSDGK